MGLLGAQGAARAGGFGTVAKREAQREPLGSADQLSFHPCSQQPLTLSVLGPGGESRQEGGAQLSVFSGRISVGLWPVAQPCACPPPRALPRCPSLMAGGLRLGSFCKMEESPLHRRLGAHDRGKALLPLQQGLDGIILHCMD